MRCKNFVTSGTIMLLLFFALSITASSQTSVIKGKVYNGTKGLKNVVVTDGSRCVITDRSGFYTLPVNENVSYIYISTPSGYLSPDSAGIPRFYKRISPQSRSYDFDLVKNIKGDSKHVLLVHADPQFFKKENFKHYEKVIADCNKTIEHYKNQEIFGIDCGDLVGDKPELYPMYIQHLSKTGIPFYRAKGNHDMVYGGRTHETASKTYSSIFGPTYYSFNKGNAHYIVLDNVFYIGRDYFYIGYLPEEMFRWLQQDLSYVKEDSTVFVAMHIPARLTPQKVAFNYDAVNMGNQTVNSAALFKMLEPYNTHILTGHMHYNKNIIHSPKLYEHNTGAICGTWWQGNYCLDGTPIGYGVYEVDGNDVKWYFKSVGKDKDYQFRLYPPGSLKDFPDNFSVNVWNWDEDWKVEWWENYQYKGEMKRVNAMDPAVEKMCADKEKLEFSWIAPIKTDHIFTAKSENRNSKIKVLVTDRFGNKFTQELN